AARVDASVLAGGAGRARRRRSLGARHRTRPALRARLRTQRGGARRPGARDRRARPGRRARRCRRPAHPRRTASAQPRRAVLRHPQGEPVSRATKQPNPSWVIAKTDLRQLMQARDFWLPLTIVALLFFVIIPTFL